MRTGFMLLEFALVILLMGIIFCLAMPTMYSLNQITVHMELERLRTHFISLQQQALVKQTASPKELSELVFDTNTQYYTVNKKPYKLASGVRFKVLPHVKGPPAKPTHTPSSPVTFPEQRAVIYPMGMRAGGTIYLSDGVGSCQYAMTVSADALAPIRCYKYDKTWLRIP